ncbi:2-nitropropane dioxygenase [Chromatiales bacterium (ex Bugula neritina AB1)]|nr:2-nitropropane dioxygenase [Chromatiales bacterium (ex Bugula neritina AB1)]
MKASDIFGTEVPIIQSPMAGVQDHQLAVAVSRGGGLGSIPCAMLDTTRIEKELAAFRAQAVGPVNVNFFCHQAPIADEQRENRWRDTLQPYFKEYSIDAIPPAAERKPFDLDAADVIESFQPEIVSFHFGLPSAELLARVKGWGASVMSTATTIEEACWLEAHGADIIIAQGYEAGGHRGMFLSSDLTTQAGTLALLPQVVRSVSVPVVAAGGIADSQGVMAALSMGAIAVQMGTAYLLCDEALTSTVHRAALKSENSVHTAITNIFSGRPARSIVNRVIREIGPISDLAPQFPLAATAISALRNAAEQGESGDFSPLWSGQNTSGCAEVSASQLTRELANRD